MNHLLADTLNGNLQEIVTKLNDLMNSFWIYIVLALGAVVVVWGAYVGIKIAVAHRNEEKINARGMVLNRMLQKYCGGMAAVLLKRFQIALSRELVYCRELEEPSLFCHSHRAFEWHIFAVYLHTFPGVAHSLIWLWRVFRLLLSRFIEISQAAHNSVQRSYAPRIIAF